MFDPDAYLPPVNRSLVYFGSRMIADIRLARERHLNVRVIPTNAAITQSIDLAHRSSIVCSAEFPRR